MTLSTLDTSLSWFEWILYATWILGSVVVCGFMIAGGWIAWRRPHAGSRSFLTGCVLLAIGSVQGILAWLVSMSGMNAGGLLANNVAIELWYGITSLMSLVKAVGFGLLILGLWRSFRWAK